MIAFIEPRITIGLIENAECIEFELQDTFLLSGAPLPAGSYRAACNGPAVILAGHTGREIAAGPKLALEPAAPGGCFAIENISIGRTFHWERLQRQRFGGDLLLDTCGGGGITAINRIGLEQYLTSVICSEMSPESDAEFLKAHCVISRSWLLAQLELKRSARETSSAGRPEWTDAAAHAWFDVCNDDHCQRYHGIGRVNEAARAALAATRGQVLVHGDEICDTRFSKCCGGITERFSTCWQDRDFAYLSPAADGPEMPGGGAPDASSEPDAEKFIRSRPDCFCNVQDRKLLSRVLPDFDLETTQFFRWTVRLGQDELKSLLREKTSIDFGTVLSLSPLARGASGRIYRLKITGAKAEKTFSKELAIRRALSPSHLYSSAFIVEPEGKRDGAPEAFTLSGAGWGHGVGLCQIGAAAMAARGYGYRDILSHYFRGAELRTIYA